MVERWSSEDVKRLLLNKYVVVIGDSIQRGFYKDLVRLLQSDDRLPKSVLKSKGEQSILGDKLIEGGNFGKMHNGKNYREVRQYHTDYHLVTFYMVTCCYSSYMETILEDLIMDPRPAVVCMSSCVWDITRYGAGSRTRYQENLQRLAKRLKLALQDDTLFIWNTATPVANYVRGGFMLQEISFLNQVLRRDVLEANFYAAQVMRDYGYDVLDLHYHFRNWINLREPDGIHWNPVGHRRMTNLVLDHIAGAFGFPLPRDMWKNDTLGQRVPRNNNKQNHGMRRPHQRAHTYNDEGHFADFSNYNNNYNNNYYCSGNDYGYNSAHCEQPEPRLFDQCLNLARMFQGAIAQNSSSQGARNDRASERQQDRLRTEVDEQKRPRHAGSPVSGTRMSPKPSRWRAECSDAGSDARGRETWKSHDQTTDIPHTMCTPASPRAASFQTPQNSWVVDPARGGNIFSTQGYIPQVHHANTAVDNQALAQFLNGMVKWRGQWS